ncbi:hypothetical protein, partial [Streptomyces sp. SID8352]|uniref:hypothetical protein n=1 Tax=Streptomyces sp. SID8352 TaxID=2690338 RepID=UPI00136AE06F
MSRLTFTLTGRDELSRVLNGTADSADRLRLRLSGITADSEGRLRDLRGRYLSVTDAQNRLADSSHGTRDALGQLREESGKLGEALRSSLITLTPAAIPLVAGLAGSAAVLAGQLGAVTLAAGAYALALGPQIGAIAEATEAEKTWQAAVEESGATSQAAAQAQDQYQKKLASLPPATRDAAVAVGLLKDAYADWSDELSTDVMAPVTKSLAVANTLLPKTTGLVKGASAQFDRLITLAAGGIQTPGFDRMNDRFTTFTERTLRNGVDRLTVFLAKAAAGELDHSGLARWMDYAREQGPAAWHTLEQIGDALLNVLEAGADVGVGMLDVINALSGIAAAVPPEAITTVVQLAIAIKAVKLAAAGTTAAKAALLALGTQVMALRTSAAGAPGAIGGVTAAISGLSRGAKLAMAGTGIGLLLIGLDMLSSKSEKPRADTDKLSTSLLTLADSGKVSGEALRVYGQDLGGLAKALDTLYDRSGFESFLQGWAEFLGTDSTDVKNAKAAIDDIDKSLASLVSQGRAKEAAAALDMVMAKLEAQGKSTDGLRGRLNDYKEALAGQAMEQRLAAEAMGTFGAQAQEVQRQLEAQKASADGLRQSIQALNDVHRQGLSGMIGFEAAVDAATKAARDNAGVLQVQGGELVLTTEKQRAAATALNDLAAKTDEAAASARESGASWAEVSRIHERGRDQLIRSATQMGLNREQAKALADQILKTPDKTAYLKGDLHDLKAKLADAKERLAKAPSSKTAEIKAEIEDLKRKIREAQAKIDGVRGKTVGIGVYTTEYYKKVQSGSNVPPMLRKQAAGGPVSRYAAGGEVVQLIPDGGAVFGPGTSTSDSIPAWLSDGEYVIRASAVDRYGLGLFDALNAERFASGGRAGDFRYAPTTSAAARISTSTVSSWYDEDVRRLKDAWAELNNALREQAKKSTAATRRAVADAQRAVNAADKALGLRAGSKVSGFSLTG